MQNPKTKVETTHNGHTYDRIGNESPHTRQRLN